LEKLGVEYEAVTGTSIGAINGAFMVQGDLSKAIDMWRNLRIEQCVRLPENIEFNSENLIDRQHAGLLLKEVIAHGGIDQSPLYDLLVQYIDPALIYSSSVEYGLFTFSLRNRSCMKVWRSDIPQDQFFSYIFGQLRPSRFQRIAFVLLIFAIAWILGVLSISLLRCLHVISSLGILIKERLSAFLTAFIITSRYRITSIF